MFKPIFTITPQIASALMHIEALKNEIQSLPVTPTVLGSLRETAKIESIHYSTMIEGNRLTEKEVRDVILKKEHFPGREHDEKEILGYYAAMDWLLAQINAQQPLTETLIKTVHALVMGEGKKNVQPTPYRDGQNVIRESGTHAIVYLPPEAQDVPQLMKELVQWLIEKEQEEFPCPLRAAIAHYQFATIHPYFDGNGRTARLLATFILHRGGYGLKGIYSLDEYYAKDLPSYYQALTIGPSHNYYMGRADADITSWLNYFCRGMRESFERVRVQAVHAYKRGEPDQAPSLAALDIRQRAVVAFAQKQPIFSAKEIEKLLRIKSRTARALCQQWVYEGFLTIVNKAKKTRKYTLAH